MAQHEIVIRNGTIDDGLDHPERQTGIAVEASRIITVGKTRWAKR